MTEMTSAEAAEVLGVSSRQVARLVAGGQVLRTRTVGRTFLLDEASVRRVQRESAGSGRAWAEPTCWAALAVLSGQPAQWLGPSARTRLAHRLRKAGAGDLAAATRRRAVAHRFAGRPGILPELREYVVASGRDAAWASNDRFRLAGPSEIAEGYAHVENIPMIVAEFALAPDPGGNIVLRGVRSADGFDMGATPIAAVAVDLMESLDPLERASGQRVLSELSAAYRRSETSMRRSPRAQD
ncbi:hypothetical protein [Tomitella biformata]|uniref:hypothetical protein n=1 Tax=Tomitella biformata TaxID=630403 RepID=UPI000464B8D1|nr:hypothetical protein [Tomitella biformata]